MRQTYFLFLFIAVSFCSFVMAEDYDEKEKIMMPEQFIGLWVEEGTADKKPGRITVLERQIIWERHGLDPEIVKAKDITVSEDAKTLMFSSGVVVVQGTPKPDAQPDGKASVVLSLDQGDLVVEISGMREKVKRCGAVPKKGYAGISREIVDGRMITCIKYAPEIHRYKKSTN